MKHALWLLLTIGLLAGLPTSAAAQAEPLYAGTSYPGTVFEYQEGSTWLPISPRLGDAVLCLAEYDGSLYAGAMSSGTDYSGGRVYRYDGGGEWTVVGSGLYDEVTALAVYHGKLYAATNGTGGHLYRYDGGVAWTRVLIAPDCLICPIHPECIPCYLPSCSPYPPESCEEPCDNYIVDWDGITALWVHTDGYLYVGNALGAVGEIIGRFNESEFVQVDCFTARCEDFVGTIYDFSAHGGALYAAAFLGRLHRSTNGVAWENLFDYLIDYLLVEVRQIEHFDGYLYLGDDNGYLRRTEHLMYLENAWLAPAAITAMVADGRDALYVGLEDGKLYRHDGPGDTVFLADTFGGAVECIYQSHTFPDIRGEHWAYEEIEGCREAGILSGYPDGHFNPTWPVTRAQMAVFISRALVGGDEHVPDGPPTASFPDVDTGFWAYKYIEWARANNIVQGFNDGNYRPGIALTRDQMAVFIARAMTGGIGQVPDQPCTEDPFPDIPCDHWARPHIQYLVSQEVCAGYPDGRFHPAEVCTRDQITVFLARAFELTG